MSKPSLKSPYRLMVEGPDDQWTIINLLGRHGYEWENDRTIRPYVEATGGVETLLVKATLSTALKTYERLGLVIDADLSPTNRWQQVRDIFKDLGITLPAMPSPDGTITPGIRPHSRVGIWLMPDNSQPGRIEEFIEKLIPSGHPVWPHAQTATTQALALGARMGQRDHLKGAIHAWLAWQRDPGLPFGTALTTEVLGHDSPEALRFVAWFKQCFT
ncbi:DUF3226 domain-containing protein [Archangium sp.]|uniref:DUF3226 domain-containing protein n=1 Tax=Archangium sp. TaxID=1872627 RepID=UPI002D7328AB|nr:DUF3226 domain-containing protein [Archangium sp.]HYO53599.1 DUF3226 domain-containing protein [Archangium sp.]